MSWPWMMYASLQRDKSPAPPVTPPPSITYELARDLIPGEFGYWGDRKMTAGEIVYAWEGSFFGLVPLSTGKIVSEHGPRTFPRFEVPLDAIKLVENGAATQ